MASLSTPAAILSGLALAGMFAGLGLFFGLRGRGTTSSDQVTSGAAIVQTTISTGSPQTSAPGGSQAAAEARSAVEALHAQLVHDCWEPSLARKPLPAKVTLSVKLDYAADGHLVMRGLQGDIGNVRADVTLCVDKELKLGPISASGQPLRITIPINFP